MKLDEAQRSSTGGTTRPERFLQPPSSLSFMIFMLLVAWGLEVLKRSEKIWKDLKRNEKIWKAKNHGNSTIHKAFCKEIVQLFLDPGDAAHWCAPDPLTNYLERGQAVCHCVLVDHVSINGTTQSVALHILHMGEFGTWSATNKFESYSCITFKILNVLLKFEVWYRLGEIGWKLVLWLGHHWAAPQSHLNLFEAQVHECLSPLQLVRASGPDYPGRAAAPSVGSLWSVCSGNCQIMLVLSWTAAGMSPLHPRSSGLGSK